MARPLFCVKCGNKIEDKKIQYCTKCGSKIEEVKDSRVSVLRVALIVFAVLIVLGGALIAVLYFNHSLLPDINPWAESVIASDEDSDNDDKKTDDADDSDEDKNVDEDSNDGKEQDKDESDIDNESNTDKSDGVKHKDDDSKSDDSSKKDEKEAVVIDPSAAGNDNDNNVHTYAVVIGDYTWEEACKEAKAFGDNAYLLHINSQEEFDYLTNGILKDYQDYMLWIGAARDEGTYSYRWVNSAGQYVGNNLVNEQYWLDGEPSFFDNSTGLFEQYVDLFYRKSDNSFVMNDVPNNLVEILPNYSGRIGFIVEFDE